MSNVKMGLRCDLRRQRDQVFRSANYWCQDSVDAFHRRSLVWDFLQPQDRPVVGLRVRVESVASLLEQLEQQQQQLQQKWHLRPQHSFLELWNRSFRCTLGLVAWGWNSPFRSSSCSTRRSTGFAGTTTGQTRTDACHWYVILRCLCWFRVAHTMLTWLSVGILTCAVVAWKCTTCWKPTGRTWCQETRESGRCCLLCRCRPGRRISCGSR